ncbi:5958_t:CDS:1 [Paraglomus occultum]|uniref:5958_t:CDS:1 n=1 Tax=Paraglomus occultum TaxID=144539 RepID=A0A9N9AVS5_9GLOM|nr:5958_t:CDS:1 [Paraglomus occultum]
MVMLKGAERQAKKARTGDAESESEKALVADAFKYEFVNSQNYVDNFYRHINFCLSKCREDSSYSPYIALIQSSGYGKSRLIAEIAQDVYVLYVCFRPSKSTGYPPRSSIASKILEEMPHQQISWFETFLECMFAVLGRMIQGGLTPSECWEMQMDSSKEKKFWTDVTTDLQHALEASSPTMESLPEQLYETNVPFKFMLCLDEARILTMTIHEAKERSLFRIIRRALQDIRWKNFMCVMLDMAGSLSNFAPTEEHDPSLRLPTVKPLKLLPPFIDVSTMDALFTGQVKNSTDRFFLGCALWTALLKSGLSIEKAVETAQRKLLGGTVSTNLQNILSTAKTDEQLAMAIAIMSVLISVDISPQPHLSHLLVSSYMATCISIKEDRSQMLVMYPSEPILTEAAFWLVDDDATLVKVLQLFAASFQCGFVDAGHRGELVARLILIIAWRKCVQKNWGKDGLYTREISLKEFLSTLFGDLDSLVTTNDSWKGLKLDRLLLESVLCFTHFIQVEYTPDSGLLEQLFRRGAAAILKFNQPGVDLLIPLKLPDDQFMYVTISVKNRDVSWGGADYTKDSTYKMKPQYIFRRTDLATPPSLPHLCFYWSLRDKREGLHRPEWMKQDESDRHLAVFSMAPFVCLSPEIRKELDAILKAYVNPFDILWNSKTVMDRTAIVKSFIPLRYSLDN